jgi:Protein-arginine deiminase (PAD)
VHGLALNANNASALFQGGPATNLQAYQQGVQAHPNATINDRDGDLVDNDADADPEDSDVDWKPANIGGYVLIDIDVPSEAEYVRDLNDAGHVLFDGGVWNAGVWTELEEVEIEGSFHLDPYDFTYASVDNRGWKLSPAGDILELGSFNVSGPGDSEGMNHVLRRSYQPQNLGYQSAVSTLHTLDWYGLSSYSFLSLQVLGEDSLGRVFSFKKFDPALPEDSAPEIWILNSNLAQTSYRELPAGYHLHLHGNQVTPAGWLGVNASPHTGNTPAARTLLWNPAGQEISTAGGLPWYFSGLTELPHGKPALACRYHGPGGLVYLLNQNGDAFKTADKLGGKNIHTFAGDGTAMTSDGNMWINGKLAPLRDLCKRFGELLDDGWIFQIHKSNQHGSYLVEAHKDEESCPQLLVSCGIVADTDRDGVIKIPSDYEGKDEWNNARGAIYSVNFDRDNNRQHATNGAIYSDAITWWNQSGVPGDENWQIDNEADVEDVTPFQIQIGAFPAGTKVYLTAGEQEVVHAIHVFPRRKAGQMAVWGAFQESGRPWNDPDNNPFDIEITEWLKPLPGESGYESGSSEIVAGSYEFGLEGLVFRGMPVPHGTLGNGKFSGIIDLGIEIQLPGTTARIDGDSIRLKVAPFLLTPNDQPTDHVFVRAMDDGLQGMHKAVAISAGLPLQNGKPSQWLQDHVEIGHTQRPGGPVVNMTLVCPYGNQLARWPQTHLLKPGKGLFALGSDFGGDGGDYGGNIELSHPQEDHPLGRILAGSAISASLRTFLEAQEVQMPVFSNISYTEVQHIDEVLSPGPDEVTYVPGPAEAIALLQEKFDTEEKQVRGVLFSRDTVQPAVAKVWKSATSTDTPYIITDQNYDDVIDEWSRFNTPEGGYLRLVGGTSGGQIAKLKAVSRAVQADAIRIDFAGNPEGKLMLQVEYYFDTGPKAFTNWKAIKPHQAISWYRKPLEGAYVVCVEKTLRWASSTPALMTVKEILEDAEFLAFNQTTLPPLIAATANTSGINNPVKIPCLFYRRATDRESFPVAIAYTPNTANLQWVDSKPVNAEPFGPRIASNTDILKEGIHDVLPGQSLFLDDWSLFHIQNGEVHCGSAAESVAETTWWNIFSN